MTAVQGPISLPRQEAFRASLRQNPDLQLPMHVAAILQKQGITVLGSKEFQTGTNGNNRVFCAEIAGDLGLVLIKHSVRDPHLVAEEIDNHRFFLGTSLAPHLSAPVLVALPDKGIFVVPFSPGIDLRTGLKTGDIDDQQARHILGHSLFALQDYMKKQDRIIQPNVSRAMIVQEWKNTLQRLGLSKAGRGFTVSGDGIFTSLEQQTKLSRKSLMQKSLLVDGESLPQFGLAVRIASAYMDMVSQGGLEYAMPLPPDLTWANIVHDGDTDTTKWIDLGFGRVMHPAWVLGRVLKGKTTATVEQCTIENLEERNAAIHITGMDVKFFSGVESLDMYAQKWLDQFRLALQDDNLPEHYLLARIVSGVREVALAMDPSRGLTGKKEAWKIAMWQMAETAKLVKDYQNRYGLSILGSRRA